MFRFPLHSSSTKPCVKEAFLNRRKASKHIRSLPSFSLLSPQPRPPEKIPVPVESASLRSATYTGSLLKLADQGTDGLTIVKDGKIVFDGTERTENPSDPAGITQQFYQALNDGNLEAAMTLVADDVKCRGECYFTGKDLFRDFMKSAPDRGDQFELSDRKVEGDKVLYNWKAYSKAGFFQAAGTETLQIRDGLIVLMESVAQ